MARTGFWSAPNAHLRCSDAEREQIAAFLRDRAAEGRLTPDELAERVGLAYGAVTIGELGRLLGDLPGSPLDGRPPRRPARRIQPAIIAMVVITLLAGLLSGSLWLLWWGAFATVLMLAVMVLALGFTLGPLVLAGAAVLFVLRRLRGITARDDYGQPDQLGSTHRPSRPSGTFM
jgi:hypothetical protein